MKYQGLTKRPRAFSPRRYPSVLRRLWIPLSKEIRVFREPWGVYEPMDELPLPCLPRLGVMGFEKRKQGGDQLM